MKNLPVYQIHNTELKRYASNYILGSLIDLGCGTKSYKDSLAPFVKRHIGLDHENSLPDKSNVDLSGTAYQIRVEILAKKILFRVRFLN